MHSLFEQFSESNQIDSVDLHSIPQFAPGTHHQVSDPALLLEGTYSQDGNDLIIEDRSGHETVVKDYFAGEPPVLTAANGAFLQPDTVAYLLNVSQDATISGSQVAGPAMLAGQGAGPTAIGHVTQLDGKVTAFSVNGQQRILDEGDAVFRGDVLRSAKNTNLKLTFQDDTVFQLGESAQIILDKFIYDPGAALGSFEATVLRGMFRYASGKLAHLSGGRHTTIKTPVAIIGVRGSELEGLVDELGATTVVHTA
ncbi:MAG: FecR domain-containing protein, partial [Magnetococcales bacterium]|nr:FecR domain-containing protein [Magnetococcales bacterium]